MNPRRLILAIVLVLGLSTTAYANAGTPLMWASALHLVIGNLILGIIEGTLLVWWFRARSLRAFPSMIAANYFSAWLGGYLLFLGVAKVPDINLSNFWFWFWLFWIAAFVITCGLEFPFVFAALWKRGQGLGRIALACLLVHAISYLLLTGWYRGASKLTMVTEFRLVPIQEMNPESRYTLFFITQDGKQVMESGLLGTSPRPVFSIPSGRQPNRLMARLNDEGRYDLYLIYHAGGPQPSYEMIQKDFACLAPLDYRSSCDGEWDPKEAWEYYFYIPALGEPSSWEFDLGFWPFEGIYATERATGEVRSWGLETPMVEWSVRNAVQLEGDRLVFQLGRDQICVLDPETRRIALIARGFGPLVAQKCPSE